MVCKKSEYSKQFRNPHWEHHIAHYKEKVDYCKYRSTSSDDRRRPQTAPNIKNNGGGVSKGKKQPAVSEDRTKEAQQRLAPQPESGSGAEGKRGGRRTLGEIQPPSKTRGKPQPLTRVKPRPSTSPPKTRKAPPGKGKSSPDQPPWKPPIAAYGWADSSRDIASKLTYNVKSSAHPAYVHSSALRAVKQREMLAAERQKEEDRLVRFGKPTARAVFTVIPPRENVWLTKYQSSYCSPSK